MRNLWISSILAIFLSFPSLTRGDKLGPTLSDHETSNWESDAQAEGYVMSREIFVPWSTKGSGLKKHSEVIDGKSFFYLFSAFALEDNRLLVLQPDANNSSEILSIDLDSNEVIQKIPIRASFSRVIKTSGGNWQFLYRMASPWGGRILSLDDDLKILEDHKIPKGHWQFGPIEADGDFEFLNNFQRQTPDLHWKLWTSELHTRISESREVKHYVTQTVGGVEVCEFENESIVPTKNMHFIGKDKLNFLYFIVQTRRMNQQYRGSMPLIVIKINKECELVGLVPLRESEYLSRVGSMSWQVYIGLDGEVVQKYPTDSGTHFYEWMPN